MVRRKRIDSSFIPATWWDAQQTLQWIARPRLRRAVEERNRHLWDRGKWPRNTTFRNRKEAMYIIAVSEEAFSGGEELAKLLAKSLGVPFVDSAALIERAVALGGDRIGLGAAVEAAPIFSGRSSRHRQRQVLQLQAAQAAEIRGGSVVCYGPAADLLTLDARRVFRIGIHASHRSRRLRVQKQLKIHGSSADRYLNACDRNRRRWLLYRFGAHAGCQPRYDLLINLEQVGFDATCAAVCEMICDRSRFIAADLASIESFALSACIQAALARRPETAHLDLGIEIHGGVAILHGTVRTREEIDSIKRVPLPVNVEIDFSHIRLTRAENEQDLNSRAVTPTMPNWKLAFRDSAISHPIWVSAGVSGMILLGLAALWAPGHLFRRADAHLASFAGVITDSECGLLHRKIQQSSECVRYCVRINGAKYVLDDGAHILTLADQKAGERFAGQRVLVTGFVDKNTDTLQARTVRAAVN